MLGLNSSLMTSGPIPFSPDDIDNLIGWFDFTDVSTMFQDHSGNKSNPMSSATGSPIIGHIVNKSKLSTKICEYLEGTNTGPNWNIAGKYLDSDGNNDDVMRARSTATALAANDGGVASNDLSTAVVNYEALGVFIVMDPDVADPSNPYDHYFDLDGQEVSGLTNTNSSISLRHEGGGSGTGTFRFQVTGNTFTGFTVATPFGTYASKQLVSVVTGSGTNASDIYINGSSQVSFTSVDVDVRYDQDPFSGADIQRDYVSVNGSIKPNGGLINTGTCVDGKIYEVLLYNKALTSDEIETIHNHLISKHNIT